MRKTGLAVGSLQPKERRSFYRALRRPGESNNYWGDSPVKRPERPWRVACVEQSGMAMQSRSGEKPKRQGSKQT